MAKVVVTFSESKHAPENKTSEIPEFKLFWVHEMSIFNLFPFQTAKLG